jgi:uncharacterized iron-regulated membrane protein
MRFRIAARKTHKWLALLVGAQLVIWSLTGLYMVTVHIDTIHGDHLVRAAAKPAIEASALADPIATAHAHGGDAVRLAAIDGRAALIITTPDDELAVDARTGTPLAPRDEAAIRRLAAAAYTGDEPIASARLITDVPGEIRGRKPPLWRVEFDHWNKPTFYLSPVTGELITRRHELWRVFDFAWMLHIMDYETRDNVNNWLLRGFTLAALALVLSGAWLLFYAFPRRKREKVAP